MSKSESAHPVVAVTGDLVPISDAPVVVVGLEDLDARDISIPRLNILHKEAMFQDSLSNEKWAEIDTVVLGICKQRVLWEPTLSEDAKPLCKSYNGLQGVPSDTFPWVKAGLKKPASADTLISCENCALQEWNSHPTRKNVAWCTDQRIFVCLLNGAPYLLTLQRSAMKAAKGFATNFVKTQQPTFTKWAHIKLTPQKMGSVEYSVPVITVGKATYPSDHFDYAQTYRDIRGFVQTRRTADADAPMAATKSGASNSVDDDEVPF